MKVGVVSGAGPPGPKTQPPPKSFVAALRTDGPVPRVGAPRGGATASRVPGGDREYGWFPASKSVELKTVTGDKAQKFLDGMLDLDSFMAYVKVSVLPSLDACMSATRFALLSMVPGMKLAPGSDRLAVTPLGSFSALGDSGSYGIRVRLVASKAAIEVIKTYFTMASAGDLQFGLTGADAGCACLLPFGKDSSQLVRLVLDKDSQDPQLLASVLAEALTALPSLQFHWLGLGDGMYIRHRFQVKGICQPLQPVCCSFSSGCNVLMAMVSGAASYLSLGGRPGTQLVLPIQGANGIVQRVRMSLVPLPRPVPGVSLPLSCVAPAIRMQDTQLDVAVLASSHKRRDREEVPPTLPSASGSGVCSAVQDQPAQPSSQGRESGAALAQAGRHSPLLAAPGTLSAGMGAVQGTGAALPDQGTRTPKRPASTSVLHGQGGVTTRHAAGQGTSPAQAQLGSQQLLPGRDAASPPSSAGAGVTQQATQGVSHTSATGASPTTDATLVGTSFAHPPLPSDHVLSAMTPGQLRDCVGHQLLGPVTAVLDSLPPTMLPEHPNLGGKLIGMIIDSVEVLGTLTPAAVGELAAIDRAILLGRVEEGLRILQQERTVAAMAAAAGAGQGAGDGLGDAEMINA